VHMEDFLFFVSLFMVWAFGVNNRPLYIYNGHVQY